MARFVFRAIERGILWPTIHQRYLRAAAAEAHRDLAARRTVGSTILLP